MTTGNGHVDSRHRFRGDFRCPVCGGTEDDARGQGQRCHGFLGGDEAWAHCTRDECAGSAAYSPASQTYAHRLKGDCPCGVEHAPADEPPKRRKRGTIDQSYAYRDERGEIVFEVVRFKDPKGFAQRRLDGKRGWAWGLGAVQPVLYRLPELLAADPAEVVLVPEGEKDVDRLRSQGFVATCNPMGAGKWRKVYAEALRGRCVAILPDNDPPGREHAQQVARSVAGLATEVKIIELSGLPDKGDVSDFFEAGNSAEVLRGLVANAPVWVAPDHHPAVVRDRPVIVITTEAHIVIEEAIAALAADPEVFQRGGSLVRVVRDPIRGDKFARPPDAPRIATIPPASLLETLSKAADVVKERSTRDGIVTVPVLPPDWVIAGVAARACWTGIRPLDFVTEAPMVRPDGSILDTRGYDEQTATLYVPNAEFPSIPPHPSREDARWCAATLLALVADFPFADTIDVEGKSDGGDCHRAVWLAALLTVLVRAAIDGPSPLFVIDATTPGAGKTLLAELIAVISFGRALARSPYPDDDAELRKVITSVALAGDRVILLDNVASALGGSALDAAITATSWRDRRLGASEMMTMPLFTTWLATGNNVSLKGDILRRVVYCRLEPVQERPEERDPSKFSIREPLDRHVLRRRPELVAAGLTIIRAFFIAGRPDQRLVAVDFRGWSDLVRSAVYWAIGADPCATRGALVAADSGTAARMALVEGWSQLPGADRGVTVAEAAALLQSEPTRYAILRDALMERSRTNELPSRNAIGRRLTELKGRVINGKSLQVVPLRAGAKAWKVTETGPLGDDSDDGCDPLGTPREKIADKCSTRSGEMGSNSPHHRHHHHQGATSWNASDNEIDWSRA